jgi:hypothetical protein
MQLVLHQEGSEANETQKINRTTMQDAVSNESGATL